MDPKFFNLLGLCRKAGRFSGGHDAAFESIAKGKAKACYLTADASDRLKQEFRETTRYQGRNIPLTELDCSMKDLEIHVGKKAAVFTVNDDGFAAKLNELLSKEDR